MKTLKKAARRVPTRKDFDRTVFDTFNRAAIERIAKLHKVTDDQLREFFARVTVQPDTGCWQWTGHLTTDGLPTFRECPDGPARLRGKGGKYLQTPMANRTSFVWFCWKLMPYPRCRLVSTCGNRGCVHPAHLAQQRVREKQTVPINTQTLAEIFSHVEVFNGCWVWTWTKNATGYAVYQFSGQPLQSVDAITFGWFAETKAVVTSPSQLLHACNRRACVNPAHFDIVPLGERKKLLRRPAADESSALPSDTSVHSEV